VLLAAWVRHVGLLGLKGICRPFLGWSLVIEGLGSLFYIDGIACLWRVFH